VVELSPSRKWQHASCADICRKRNKADVFLGCSTAIAVPRSAMAQNARAEKTRCDVASAGLPKSSG
jgi:hypothetical protein